MTSKEAVELWNEVKDWDYDSELWESVPDEQWEEMVSKLPYKEKFEYYLRDEIGVYEVTLWFDRIENKYVAETPSLGMDERKKLSAGHKFYIEDNFFVSMALGEIRFGVTGETVEEAIVKYQEKYEKKFGEFTKKRRKVPGSKYHY